MSERQYGNLSEIRRDHVARYEWARDLLVLGGKKLTVLDAACGCGYGSAVMAESGLISVLGIDASEEAIQYAESHYSKDFVAYKVGRLPAMLDNYPQVDVVVSFETVEHIKDDVALLAAFRKVAKRLLASVPNQERLPYSAQRFPFHFRHYTKSEFETLLNMAGWSVKKWYGQESAYSDVVEGVNGRTLVADCE